MGSGTAVAAVVFDVGETLVDETGQWRREAERLGVPALTFFAALGAVIERGEHHGRAWHLVGRGEQRRLLPPFTEDDLYPDALACLRRLADAGYAVGLAANQPERAETAMRALDTRVALVASSQRWGVEKPSPAFFERICTELCLPPAAVAYVGDRLDNDVVPAKRAGMVAVHVRRGPWGHIHATHPAMAAERAMADVSIAGLDDLPGALSRP